MLHDLVAKSGIIYLWDAKLAKLRSQVLRDEAGESTGGEDDRDALDAIMEAMMENEGRDHNDDDDNDDDSDEEWIPFFRDTVVSEAPNQDPKAYDTFMAPTNT